MSDYQITDYTKKRANELNVNVKTSKNKNKKIDVYKYNKYLFSIGANGYLDYPLYIKRFGMKIANERRRLYRARHANNINKIGTPGWYASKLLW